MAILLFVLEGAWVTILFVLVGGWGTLFLVPDDGGGIFTQKQTFL